ncbi:LysR family transcriptional regulator [Mesorhizobium sp. Root102]|jgi:DNA-binding transcriptional LysR family regulator|uniref:LysR family transcriptional regulator n=1 Tax=Mesorhizobium sp. Root102 TaxID=1736422 RepID=UPI0006F3E12F|nr:LysR family transcriptional regulator [Mesorhizobium sp. Root102]KQU83223.1 LysR family transcriptional regulator [Mesorhizobium sp. Root102]
MHWDDLRIFLAVARDGSISGAAKRMNIQHSTVSRRIRLLETQLGTRLIERKKSGYELTPAGDELRMAAGKMELEVLEVEGALGGQEDRVAGELTVSAINNVASSVLMPIFAGFSEAYPDIRLHVQVSNTYVSLAERHADIAIRLTNTPLDTLVGTRLANVASAVYGEKRYLEGLRASGATPLWIGVECCAFHRSWTHAACPDHRHSFFVDDTLLTLAALKQGLGLAYLPCFMGDSAEELGRFRQPDPIHDLGLWLLFHPDLRRTKRVRVFREHMVARIRDQSALFEGRLPRQIGVSRMNAQHE